MNCLHLIASDYRRYRATGSAHFLVIVLATQGFWASSVYRVSHALLRIRFRPLRLVFFVLAKIAQKLSEIVTAISLPPDCEIGEGLYIGHFGPLVISSQARLGRHCNLSQSVVIGVAGRGARRGAPVIGNRVYVGPHAVIVGAIEIGDDVAIGAGAIVTKSVAARSVVVGNPARVISQRGSFDFVSYPQMENDPERRASLETATNEASVETSGAQDATSPETQKNYDETQPSFL